MESKFGKNIDWNESLLEAFNWDADKTDQLLVKLKKRQRSEGLEDREFDAIMDAVILENKARNRNSTIEFEIGYKLKSVKYKRLSAAMLPRLKEIIKSEIESYPIWGAESDIEFNWDQQISNLIWYANNKIDLNDMVDFFHDAYVELKERKDEGKLGLAEQKPAYFFTVVKNMITASMRNLHKHPTTRLDDVNILIDCFSLSIDTPKQAEQFFRNLITVGDLSNQQAKLFKIIIEHAESFDSSNKNRKFWQEVRVIVQDKGDEMSDSAFRKMKERLLDKIKKSGEYIGFASQSDIDNLRIATELLRLFEYLEVQS